MSIGVTCYAEWGDYFKGWGGDLTGRKAIGEVINVGYMGRIILEWGENLMGRERIREWSLSYCWTTWGEKLMGGEE